MMMAAEATRLAQMDKRMDQMAKLLETFEARLGSLENACGLAATSKPTGTSTGQKSYTRATGVSGPPPHTPPTVVPPPQATLRSLKPGKAVIHSDPT
ncbi:uncharacterized protein VP01_3163g1, partial [Puccinia sorghi]